MRAWLLPSARPQWASRILQHYVHPKLPPPYRLERAHPTMLPTLRLEGSDPSPAEAPCTMRGPSHLSGRPPS